LANPVTENCKEMLEPLNISDPKIQGFDELNDVRVLEKYKTTNFSIPRANSITMQIP